MAATTSPTLSSRAITQTRQRRVQDALRPWSRSQFPLLHRSQADELRKWNDLAQWTGRTEQVLLNGHPPRSRRRRCDTRPGRECSGIPGRRLRLQSCSRDHLRKQHGFKEQPLRLAVTALVPTTAANAPWYLLSQVNLSVSACTRARRWIMMMVQPNRYHLEPAFGPIDATKCARTCDKARQTVSHRATRTAAVATDTKFDSDYSFIRRGARESCCSMRALY